jgi:hypothetical protein
MPLLTSLALAALAFAGREVGNGGDPVGLEFEQCAHEALLDIANAPARYPGLDPAALEEILGEARTIVVRGVRLYAGEEGVGQESAAVNYPAAKQILVDGGRWEEITSVHVRRALALHELLGLAGLESTGQYPYSHRYLQNAGESCEKDLCISFPTERVFTEIQFRRFLARPLSLHGQPACSPDVLATLKETAVRQARAHCFGADYDNCEVTTAEILANGALWDDEICRTIGPVFAPYYCGKPRNRYDGQALGCVVRAVVHGARK